MIAPRCILSEPVISHDHLERLVQDCEPRERRILFDRERRVDPDRWRVGHRDEPAAEAFLIERLGAGLGERLFGGSVANQLDAAPQAASATLAVTAVLLLQRLDPAEHRL